GQSPGQKLGNPTVRIRVAGRTNVRLDAAGRAVAADHVEELICREMGQLVETDQRDLRALPVVHRGGKLQMRKLDLATARPAPFLRSEVRDATEPRIEVLALVPQPSGIGDLGCGAAEEYRGKAGTRLT